MKKLPLLVAALGAFVVIAPTSALAASAGGPKARMMAKYDLNHNGVIDGDEVAAVRKDFAAEPEGDLKKYDTNKNGKLEDSEIAEIKPPGGGKGGEKDGAKKKGGKDKTAKDAAPAPTTESNK